MIPLLTWLDVTVLFCNKATVTSHLAYQLSDIKSDNKRRITADISLDGQVLLVSLGHTAIGYILPPLQSAQAVLKAKNLRKKPKRAARSAIPLRANSPRRAMKNPKAKSQPR